MPNIEQRIAAIPIDYTAALIARATVDWYFQQTGTMLNAPAIKTIAATAIATCADDYRKESVESQFKPLELKPEILHNLKEAK